VVSQRGVHGQAGGVGGVDGGQHFEPAAGAGQYGGLEPTGAEVAQQDRRLHRDWCGGAVQVGGHRDRGVDQVGLGQPGAGGGPPQQGAPVGSPRGGDGEDHLVGGLPTDLRGLFGDPAQGGGDQVDHLDRPAPHADGPRR